MNGSTSTGSSKKRLLLLALGVPIVILVLAGVYAKWFLVLHKTVGSGSMEPTYPAGSRVAFRLALDSSLFTRGKVVLMKPEKADKEVWLRRIVGLPGETLRISSEGLEVNGKMSPWAELGSIDSSGIQPSGPFTVPADSYFMIGDNMKNAIDSRMKGAYPRDAILGIVQP